MAVNQNSPTISAGEAGIRLNLAWRLDGEGPGIGDPELCVQCIGRLESPEKLTQERLQLMQRAREVLERIEEAARRGRHRLVLPRSHQ